MNFKVKWNGMGAVLGLSLLILSSAWASVPPLNKVVWIWLEGTPYLDGISGSYVRSLTRNLPSVRFSHFHSVSPTTQGNGIAMIAGTDLGVQDNDLTRIFVPTLVDLLEAKGIPWKVYAEDFPGACYLSPGLGNYKRYRVPFLSVDRIQSDRYLCMNILNYSNYQDDLKNAKYSYKGIYQTEPDPPKGKALDSVYNFQDRGSGNTHPENPQHKPSREFLSTQAGLPM